MHKMLQIFIVTCLAWSSSVSVSAMQQMPKHELIGVINPQYTSDMITFVKQITEKYLVIFDRKGHGEIFDLTDNCKPIKKFHCSESLLPDNMFICQDEDEQVLLLAFEGRGSKAFFVWNLNTSIPCYKRVLVGHEFTIEVGTVASEEELVLVMINNHDASKYSVDLKWSFFENKYEDLPSRISIESFNPIDEGLVVNVPACDGDKVIDLKKKSFDILSPSYNHFFEDAYYRRQSHARCYHKVDDGPYYFGHEGLVTIWKPV